MNEHVKPRAAQSPSRPRRRPTRAAEGLLRWRWTTAELERVAVTGVFEGGDDFELIGGEMVPMSPNGRRHDLVREVLERSLRKQETDTAHVIGEIQLNLSEDTYCKPDVLVRPASILSADLVGSTVLLVIEVADSSLDDDLTTKASLYAAHGVREYWVVEAWSLTTTVHRDPDSATATYRSVETKPATEPLSVLLAPTLSVRLAALAV